MMLDRLVFSLVLIAGTMWLPAAHATELRPFTRGSFADILAANVGKPLVVNFWSVTCAPCLSEMPQWRTLAQDHAEISLVLVSTDSFDDQARIQQVLKRYDITSLESWVFAEAHKTRLRYDIDKAWRGELPRTYLIGANGKIEARSGVIPLDDLNAWLEP
ncbi:TlpA family protein disulfide reductase [Magnetovibrio blakemorei]|nr:TlpA disulfide reductase family protein [Magnetovibrio blakemorei]